MALRKPLDATQLPPFDGEKRVVKEPLRGLRTIDLTVQPDDVWQRIRRGWGMPDLDNKRVQQMMAYYAARPDYLQRIFERSRRYLYHIVDELEKRGMPTELALLPMVESAYNPMAYSRSHASGIWQFIPPTGKRYLGLQLHDRNLARLPGLNNLAKVAVRFCNRNNIARELHGLTL